MRELPGRASRTALDEPPVRLTRDDTGNAQRERILRATGELVAKRGYHAVRVELIVKRARVSFKTFYNLFSSKENAFLALFDWRRDGTRERILAELTAEAAAPWPQQVVIAMRVFFDVIREDPLLARACIVEAPTAGPVIAERYERAMGMFVPLFKLGRGVSSQGDAELPDTLEDTLAGGFLWSAYQRLINSEADSIEEMLPEAIVFVLRPYIGREDAERWADWSRSPATAPPSTAP